MNTDTLKLWVKSPFFWLVISITIISISLLVVSIVKPSSSKACPPDYVRDPNCGNNCRPSCKSPLTWQCDKQQCVCEPGFKQCGGDKNFCCPNDMCIVPKGGKDTDGVCCTEERLCPVDSSSPTGPKKCCDPGFKCYANKCVESCGTTVDGKPYWCPDKTSCLKTEFQNKTQADKFINDFGPAGLNLNPTLSSDGNIGYVCTPQTTCNWEMTQQDIPSVVDNNVHLVIDNEYIKGDNADTIGFCYPNNINNNEYKLECIGTKDKSECKGNDACIWYDLMDPASKQDIQNNAELLKNINNGNYGNFCKTEANKEHTYTAFAYVGGENCDAIDCWKRFSTTGANELNWNNNTKICSTKQNIDIPMCTTPEDCPEKLDTKNYSCNNGIISPRLPTTYICSKDPENPILGKCVVNPDITAKADELTVFANKWCDHQCECPDGYRFWGGSDSSGARFPGGCYKNKFSAMAPPTADICAANKFGPCHWGTCTTTGEHCGTGWTTSAEGNCGEFPFCSTFCSDTPLKGSMYCPSPSNGTWKKCDDNNCSSKWGSLVNNVYASGCVTVNDDSTKWCSPPPWPES